MCEVCLVVRQAQVFNNRVDLGLPADFNADDELLPSQGLPASRVSAAKHGHAHAH